MTALDRLPAWEPETGRLQAVIEAPRGSRNKYKCDPESGQIRSDEVRPPGISFPLDIGFVPSTAGEDGDPVDVPVVMDEPAFPGCVVTAKLIGVTEPEQPEGGVTIRNDRLVASPGHASQPGGDRHAGGVRRAAARRDRTLLRRLRRGRRPDVQADRAAWRPKGVEAHRRGRVYVRTPTEITPTRKRPPVALRLQSANQKRPPELRGYPPSGR